MVLQRFRQHSFMHEVVYVWDLKQNLNRIYRKQRKVEAKVEEGDQEAMIIMNFQYRGSKQLYELDDNTITMEGLLDKIRVHEQRAEALGMRFSTVAFDPDMLSKY